LTPLEHHKPLADEDDQFKYSSAHARGIDQIVEMNETTNTVADKGEEIMNLGVEDVNLEKQRRVYEQI